MKNSSLRLRKAEVTKSTSRSNKIIAIHLCRFFKIFIRLHKHICRDYAKSGARSINMTNHTKLDDEIISPNCAPFYFIFFHFLGLQFITFTVVKEFVIQT